MCRRTFLTVLLTTALIFVQDSHAATLIEAFSAEPIPSISSHFGPQPIGTHAIRASFLVLPDGDFGCNPQSPSTITKLPPMLIPPNANEQQPMCTLNERLHVAETVEEIVRRIQRAQTIVVSPSSSSSSVYQGAPVLPWDTPIARRIYEGTVVVVPRGVCHFVEKVLTLQALGAAAVLVYNFDGLVPVEVKLEDRLNHERSLLFPMAHPFPIVHIGPWSSSDLRWPVIPSQMISFSDAMTLRHATKGALLHITCGLSVQSRYL